MIFKYTCSLTAVAVALVSTAAAQAPRRRSKLPRSRSRWRRTRRPSSRYSWVETTVISLKGEVKKQQQKQCSYGPDGKVQKTPIGEQEPKAKEPSGGGRRGGRAKEAVVAKKVGEVKDYMEDVAALVHQYVPPDPQKIQAVQGAGKLAVQPGAGVTVLNLKDYLKPGDLLAIGFDPAAKAMRSYTVSSYVEKPEDDAVNMAVTFGSLADGTSYPQQIVLDVKAKNIQVKVTNAGHKKAGT